MTARQNTLTEALESASEFTARSFPNLIKHLEPTWVEEALMSTGAATMRRRRIPAEQAVWLVLGMAVMRDKPITTVARQLEIALPASDGAKTVASSALTQARARLGAEPMEWLFLRSAEEWAHRSADADRWRGLALYGVDGTTMRVADSVENREHFGSQDSGRHDGGRDERLNGYPLMRVVVLMALRSHLLAAAAFGPFNTDERVYAASLWDTVPDHSLVLIDRNFLSAGVLVPLTTTGVERNWITRAKSNTTYTTIRRLRAGDELVEFKVSSEARKKDPTLPMHFDARVVRYQRKGYKPQLLITSLVDEKRYPAAEIRALYHERWEIELAFDEIKTHMLERLETIRSKSPAAVAQEMWGVLIAYNLVRLEMQRVARELDVHPTRISFVAALRECVLQWQYAAAASPGAIPASFANVTDQMRHFILPPRRSDRSFPRAVKLKMSNYARKMPIKSSSRSRAK
ncbi:MAG: IS4 family transposase [Gemmatimonadaceae bacterium]|nr:IS4 family transposase [Gemmatimonadaceae bacterium]